MGNMLRILKGDTKPTIENYRIRSKRWFNDRDRLIDDYIIDSQRKDKI